VARHLDEDGERRSIDSGDVNDYLREISGAEITGLPYLGGDEPGAARAGEARRPGADQEGGGGDGAGGGRAARNTLAVCRKCYIHPAVIESFATGKLAPFVALLSGRAAAAKTARVERALIRFLKVRGVPT
jgi:DNA topoisomerase-1